MLPQTDGSHSVTMPYIVYATRDVYEKKRRDLLKSMIGFVETFQEPYEYGIEGVVKTDVVGA
jgi:hypothetical protein